MRNLEDIIEEFETIRQSFRDFSNKSDNNKDSLLEFQHRFIDLKADLRPWHSKMLQAAEMRSDKGATAIKMRLAVSMVRDEYVFKEETPMYEKAPSISNAEKFAGATKEYKEFLDQRVFYKESLVNIADMREDLNLLITLCRDKQNR